MEDGEDDVESVIGCFSADGEEMMGEEDEEREESVGIESDLSSPESEPEVPTQTRSPSSEVEKEEEEQENVAAAAEDEGVEMSGARDLIHQDEDRSSAPPAPVSRRSNRQVKKTAAKREVEETLAFWNKSRKTD